MCEILDRYINKGIEQGLEQGLELGMEKGLKKSVFDGFIICLRGIKCNIILPEISFCVVLWRFVQISPICIRFFEHFHALQSSVFLNTIFL